MSYLKKRYVPTVAASIQKIQWKNTWKDKLETATLKRYKISI